MTTETYYYVTCDVCSVAAQSDFSGTRSEARSFARRAGWKRRRIDGKVCDVCDECQEAGR